jgi:Putative lumazine-binding
VFTNVILVFVVLGIASSARADGKTEVQATIRQYFRGHATGSPAEMRRAFLPSAHIEGVRDGNFVSWTVDEYCARFDGVPAKDENLRKRSIDLVNVTGGVAVARATLVHGETTFTDYFLLVRVDGEWKIANKVYASRPTSPRKRDR